MSHNKNSNKGISMIELVVTIAIMGIVVAGSVGIYTWVASSSFKEAYKCITDSMEYARTEQLSKAGDWSVNINQDGGKLKSKVSDGTGSVEKIFDDIKSGTKIYGIRATDGALIPVNASTNIEMVYKSNGAFRYAQIYDGGADTDINGIRVEYSKYSKTIKLAIDTGKFFTD